MGFAVYTELTCKQCKPDRFFHKREGLKLHSVIQHGREGAMRTIQSLPLKTSSSARAAASNTRATRASSKDSDSTNQFSSGMRRSQKSLNVGGIEIIELEDEEDEDILVLADGNAENVSVHVRPQSDDVNDVEDINEDEDIECVEIVEVSENHIKSFKPKNYKWMENSPLYQPEVMLMNSLNLKIRQVNTSSDEVESVVTPQIGTENFSSDEVELVVPPQIGTENFSSDEVELVVLPQISSENFELHEETVDGEEIVVLDDTILLDGSPVKKSSHIRNLFTDDEDSANRSKRTLVDNLNDTSSKRVRHDDRDELLLVENENDDNNDLMDIQNMLEVTMEENDESVVDIEFSPFTAINVNSQEEILEIDLEPEVEVLQVDKQDNIEAHTVDEKDEIEAHAAESFKPKSIKDLVKQWANEEESLISRNYDEVGKIRTKKSWKDLKPKPYLTSRG